MGKTRFCHCSGTRVSVWDCDGCPDDSWLDDGGPYNEPPLYPAGHLAGLTMEQLEVELSRQGGIQGAAGDNLDRPGIEDVIQRAEARWRLVETEIKRRNETSDLRQILGEALSSQHQSTTGE